jgi:hypothetical protein
MNADRRNRRNSTGLKSSQTAFLQCIEIPTRIPTRLELALGAGELLDEEHGLWTVHGWDVSDAWDHASSPWDYQRYIQRSRGEFSCARPAYAQLQSAWSSDRTVCYLASGKPAIVEHGGPSSFLPERDGLFRFRTMDEAIPGGAVESDHGHHARAARALAEEYLDSEAVIGSVLVRALD